MIKHYFIYIYIYIQFVDGVRVIGIPRHIQTNFFKLVTLFQRILKVQLIDINMATSSLPEKLLSFFGDFE